MRRVPHDFWVDEGRWLVLLLALASVSVVLRLAYGIDWVIWRIW